MSRKFYITTAIDYVNSLPHIGTAYEKIGADALARWRRREGDDVYFQMGNDEHSTSVHKSAQEKEMDPKAYCDLMRKRFESIWQMLEISYDGFIQTTEKRHHKAVKTLFKKIHENGDIYKGYYEGWYCEFCEAFYTEKDLVDGHCPNHKAKPKWLHEENYFFRLSRFQEPLLKLYEEHPEFILPEVRRNEIRRVVEAGLQDTSISRAGVPWGIPVPIDENEVVYVWFDALINYISAIGYPDDSFKEKWPADIHIIGKDITRFHCVIWPAMLLSAGLELPKTVFGHGFVYLKGEKMSKTLGNIVNPLDVIASYGADGLRYYLLAESSFGADGDFTWDGFIHRYNSDLANDLGNSLSRTVGMAFRYQDGIIRPPQYKPAPEDKQLVNQFTKTLQEMRAAMDPLSGDIRTHQALSSLWNLIGAIDKYIDQAAPWALHKEGKTERVNDILYNIVAALRMVALLLEPFLPLAAKTIWERLGLTASQKFRKIRYPYLAWHDLPDEIRLQRGELLFPRIQTEEEKEKTTKKGEKMETKTEKKEKKLSIEEFSKVELRIAKILSAEKVEGADKLLRLQIDLGYEQRQLVAGIALSYAPDELIGKQIVVVTNLKPAKVRGIESEGMLLAATGDKGPIILCPESDVPPGSSVK